MTKSVLRLAAGTLFLACRLAAQPAEVPFLIETVETLTAPGGAPVEATRYIHARSSGGATRFEMRQLVGWRLHEVRIRRPDGLAIVESLAVNAKRTTRLTAAEQAQERGARRDPATGCVGAMAGGDPPAAAPKSSETDTIGGIATYKLTFDEGQVIWRAPEFGCVEVKRRQMFGASTSNLDLVSVRRGDPPMGLFSPSAGTVEMSPLKMYEAWIALRQLGGSADPQVELGRQMARRAEEFYWAHRP